MKLKPPSKRNLSVIAFMGFAFSSGLIFHFLSDLHSHHYILTGPIQNVSATLLIASDTVPYGQEKTNYEPAVRLKIPNIDVDAAIEYVGLTSNGAMDAPKGPADVAWFDLGPRPGQVGSSVIAGHFGWKNGIPAAFDDLNRLAKGDKLYVEDEGGTTTVFVVRELRTYGENEDTSSVFSSNDGEAHLNLITCEGVWNKTKKSYSNRLVVFTDREAE